MPLQISPPRLSGIGEVPAEESLGLHISKGYRIKTRSFSCRMATGYEKQKTKKAKSSKPSTSASARRENSGPDDDISPKVPLRLQQRCLDIFRDALSPTVDDAATLQEVKGHLYNRDFLAAFGKAEYLRVYASRWSPSRALAYLDVLTDIRSSNAAHLDLNDDTDFSIMCVGGGAGGELVALAGWLNSLRGEISGSPLPSLSIALLDIADWTSVVDGLREGIMKPPQLSNYASKAKRDANEALLAHDDVSINFQQMDILSTGNAIVESLNDQFASTNLITFMFTLNELYSASMSETQTLLSRITAATGPGTLLLIVDSPGSYSTISLNGTEKRYPMQWLLDYTMVGASKKLEMQPTNAKWEKLIDDSSRWFRLPSKLNYPIELENMRYQIHLYRRLDDVE